MKKARIFFVDQSSAILMATSDGRIVEDLQPMTLCYVTCVAEQDGRREEAGQQRRRPRRHRLLHPGAAGQPGQEGRRSDRGALRRGAGPGRRDAGRPGRRLFRDPPPRGHRPRDGGRLQPQGRLDLLGQDRQAGGQALRLHRGRGDPGARPRRHQRGRRGQLRGEDDAGGGRDPHHLPPRLHLREALRGEAHRQRAARELPAPADAADALDLHAARAPTGRTRSSSRSRRASTARTSPTARSRSAPATSPST